MRWSRDNGVIAVAMRLFDNLRWVGSPLFLCGKNGYIRTDWRIFEVIRTYV